jgi:hypothetical protein
MNPKLLTSNLLSVSGSLCAACFADVTLKEVNRRDLHKIRQGMGILEDAEERENKLNCGPRPFSAAQDGFIKAGFVSRMSLLGCDIEILVFSIFGEDLHVSHLSAFEPRCMITAKRKRRIQRGALCSEYVLLLLSRGQKLSTHLTPIPQCPSLYLYILLRSLTNPL